MTQVNQNINQNLYNQQLYAQQQASQKQTVQRPIQNPVQQPVKIPSYYYVPENSLNRQNFVETIKQYDMMGVVSPFFEHPLMVLASWLGLSVGIDAYSKACGGKYENSLVKKAANLGDSIENSNIVQSKPVQSVLSKISSAKNKFVNTAKKSAILRAMKNTPSMPEWSMVRSQMFDQKQEIVQDFLKITDTLHLDNSDEIKIKDLGITSKEKEMLKKTFNVKKISEIPNENVVSQVLLERINRTPAQIKKIQALGADKTLDATKKELLKEMNITPEKLKNIKDDVFGKYVNDVISATKKAGNRIRIGAGHYGWMGPLTKPFERTVGCDEVYNKLFSLTKEGTKTATGRFMSKAMQMMHRGLTWGNGKLGALLFIAPILVEVASNVKKADKDQKVGTAIGGMVESSSWVLTFPLALRMMHSLGGAQYAGMSQDQVKAFRDKLTEFNNNVKNGVYKNDRKAYDSAKKAVKDILKVKNQGIFTKGVRKLAQFLTMDLETFQGYKTSNGVMNISRKVPNFFRNVVGVPMRLVVFGLLSMGLLDGAIKKCTTAIFGKSYDSTKQEENESALKQQKQFLAEDLNRRLYEAQKIKQYGTQSQVLTQAQPQTQQQKQMMSARGKAQNSSAVPQIYPEDEKVDNYTYIPSQENVIPNRPKNKGVDNYTYIPSSECKIPNNSKADEKQRRYIPSQQAANIQKTFDNSGLQSALDRAQKAEDKALRVLAGNFDGM